MKCPKCQGEVEAAGQVDVDGQTLDVFQCGACVVPWEFEGESFETALSFAVDAGGLFYDAHSLEPLSLN